MIESAKRKLRALTRAGWSAVGLMLVAAVAFAYWADPSTAVGRINWLSNGVARWFQLTDPGTNDYLRFRSYTGTDAMVISTANYIGVGTTEPAAMVDVASTSRGARLCPPATAAQIAPVVGVQGECFYNTTSDVLVVSTGGATASNFICLSTSTAYTKLSCD